MKKDIKHQEGKDIETTEHADGRRDVRINVGTLDVKADDPATAKAKEVIEKQVFPKLAEALVLVVVVHKPTNDFAQKVVKAPHVRKYAEAVVNSRGGESNDFVIVEHHITNGTVNVTTL